MSSISISTIPIQIPHEGDNEDSEIDDQGTLRKPSWKKEALSSSSTGNRVIHVS